MLSLQSAFGGPSKNSKKPFGKSRLEDAVDDDDEEILSDASDVEGRPDAGYESEHDDDDDLRETAEEKAVRLAKIHLEEIEREERERLEDGADIHSAVSSRLREEELKDSGRFKREVAERCRDRDLIDEAKVLRRKRIHKLCLSAVVAAPDGEHVFSASKDGAIAKWSLRGDMKLVGKIVGAGGHGDKQERKAGKKKHPTRVNALAVSSDGKYLASGDDSKLVNVWNAATLEHVHTFRGHRDSVSGLAFRRKTHTLYSCSYDRSIKIWNLDEMAYVETLFGHQDRITGIDAGVRERAVSSGGRDGSVRVWKIVEESQLVFNGPACSTDCVRLMDEDHFVTCGEDGHLSVWGTMKKKPLCTVEAAHGREQNVPDGLGEFGPSGADESVPNWVSAIAALPMTDLIASGKNCVRFICVTMTLTYAFLSLGSCDGFIRLWKCSSGHRKLEEVNRIPVTGFVNTLSFSPDGKFLVAGIGQEHRLGRWWKIKEAKNSLLVIPLMLQDDE